MLLQQGGTLTNLAMGQEQNDDIKRVCSALIRQYSQPPQPTPF